MHPVRLQRRASLAVAFLCFAGGGGLWLARRYDLREEHSLLLGFGALGAVIVAGALLRTSRDAKRAVIRSRDPEDDAVIEGALEGSAHPYRAQARRVLLAVSPRVSGKVTAVVVGLSFASAAVLVPAALRLPRWIEAEIVVALWWLVLATTLFVTLYRGLRLRDDFVYFAPWDRTPGASVPAAVNGKGASNGWSAADGCTGDIDGEGCVGGLVVLVALSVALGAAWVFVELAMPLAFALMYSLLMRAIRRAASDRRGCAGEVLRSLGWAAFWASVYVVPIAMLTWGVHAVRR